MCIWGTSMLVERLRDKPLTTDKTIRIRHILLKYLNSNNV